MLEITKALARIWWISWTVFSRVLRRPERRSPWSRTGSPRESPFATSAPFDEEELLLAGAAGGTSAEALAGGEDEEDEDEACEIIQVAIGKKLEVKAKQIIEAQRTIDGACMRDNEEVNKQQVEAMLQWEYANKKLQEHG